MTNRSDRRLAGVVEQDITMQCIDSLGRGHDLETVFSYQRSDPFAVTITFVTHEGDLPWTFSRDLLARGMTEPTGDGDVHVSPSIDQRGRAVVVVELSSPDGHLVTQAYIKDVRQFISRSFALVPEGEESQHMPIDDMILQLLTA
ncbi:SsgA family sporulation/cell division regulator [Nocardioides sp. 616]|uniref:SsgA family sporulation/cell division regulator n=1 Tax=Nocardioides sp. 616 TaxID=2268090 RepID=UPI000CE2FC79|nr:SsgA family sporulation/cell division regulator [Nocardioides sp. 616]